MKKAYPLFILLTALLSCVTVPAIYHEDPVPDMKRYKQCDTAFLSGRYKIIHSIEATMPGNRKGFIIGITDADPAGPSLHSVIMTVEGLVIFEALYSRKKGIEIKRAIDMFNSSDFALAMMKDIELIFFRPAVPLVKTGVTQTGSSLCRFAGNTSILDIKVDTDSGWEKCLYINEKKIRTITASQPGPSGMARELRLTARGDVAYSLTLTLISAEKIGH